MSAIFDKYCKNYNITDKKNEFRRLCALFKCKYMDEVEFQLTELGLTNSEPIVFDISERYKMYNVERYELDITKDSSCLNFIFTDIGIESFESLPSNVSPDSVVAELIVAITEHYKKTHKLPINDSIAIRCHGILLANIKVKKESSLAEMLRTHITLDKFKTVTTNCCLVMESLYNTNINEANKYLYLLGESSGIARTAPSNIFVYLFDKLDITNAEEIPASFKIKNLPLKDVKVNSPIIVTTNFNKVIEISGKVVIQAECPIWCDSEVTIKGSGTLVLESTSSHQPCIGPNTYDNKTRVPWSENPKEVKKITIDGVRVVCVNKAKNFAIGTYGKSYVPEVVLLNGGTLECPEMTGERRLKYSDAPRKSDSLRVDLDYYIMPRDTSWLNKYDNDYCYLYNKLIDVDPNAKSMEPNTPKEAIELALEIKSISPNLDTSCLYQANVTTELLSIYEKLIYLRMPYNVYSSVVDFERDKCAFIKSIIYGKVDDGIPYNLILRSVLRYIYRGDKTSDYEKKLMYSLIPEFRDFKNDADLYESNVRPLVENDFDLLRKLSKLLDLSNIKQLWDV